MAGSGYPHKWWLFGKFAESVIESAQSENLQYIVLTFFIQRPFCKIRW